MTDGLLSLQPSDVSMDITRIRETSVTSHDLREQAIREQAAEWAIRLAADDISPEQALALEQWCACDPRHAPALDFALNTWAELGQLGSPVPTVSAAPSIPAARPLRGRRRSVWKRVTQAAALAALAWFGINIAPGLLIPLTADYASHAGEVRHIQLPDGSSVALDTGSAIDLAYDDRERRIRLLQGEAVFTVAPMAGQETRPFIVESAGGTTRALGTRFVVSESTDSAWVGVLEHSVELALLDPPDSGIAREVLEEGQSARYDRNGITRLTEQDLQRTTGWQRGLLIFDQVPLAQVVDQLNRYRDGHILITDRQLAQRKVSGVFRLESLDSAVPRLSAELHARHVELPGVSLIY